MMDDFETERMNSAIENIIRRIDMKPPYDGCYEYREDFIPCEIKPGDYVSIKQDLDTRCKYVGAIECCSGDNYYHDYESPCREMTLYAGKTAKVTHAIDGKFFLEGIPEEFGPWVFGMFSELHKKVKEPKKKAKGLVLRRKGKKRRRLNPYSSFAQKVSVLRHKCNDR